MWDAEEFIEEVLDYFSAAEVEDALFALLMKLKNQDEPLPDFIDPSKL